MYSVAIEGNIGAGKSFFLEYLSKKFPNRINIYQEPVHKWRNVNNVNLFDLMYKDPERYGFIFQSYVQLTMLQMHDEISKIQKEATNSQTQSIVVSKDRTLILKDLTNKDQRNDNDKKRKASPMNDTMNLKKIMKTSQSSDITKECDSNSISELISKTDDSQPSYAINMMERCVFSARYIFVENLYQNNLLTPIEYSILDDTFLYLIKKQDIKLDLIIYLRSKPEECYKRMVKRSRPEETQTLQLEHFEKFHKLHEDFLYGENSLIKQVLNVPVLVIDTVDSKEKMFEKIDHHTKLIMNDMINRESLTEITCKSN